MRFRIEPLRFTTTLDAVQHAVHDLFPPRQLALDLDAKPALKVWHRDGRITGTHVEQPTPANGLVVRHMADRPLLYDLELRGGGKTCPTGASCCSTRGTRRASDLR
jgi:hypothetical protein